MSDTTKIMDAGENLINEAWKGELGAYLTLRLFSSPSSIDGDEVFADFTFIGSAWASTPSPGYGTSSTVSGKGKMVGTQRTWTHDGTGGSISVMGVALVYDNGADPEVVVKATVIDPAQTMVNVGDVFKWTENWESSSAT